MTGFACDDNLILLRFLTAYNRPVTDLIRKLDIYSSNVAAIADLFTRELSDTRRQLQERWRSELLGSKDGAQAVKKFEEIVWRKVYYSVVNVYKQCKKVHDCITTYSQFEYQ